MGKVIQMKRNVKAALEAWKHNPSGGGKLLIDMINSGLKDGSISLLRSDDGRLIIKEERVER